MSFIKPVISHNWKWKNLDKKAHPEAKPEEEAKWREEHPVHAAWIDKAATIGNEFAKSLRYSLSRYGSLTMNQIAAVSNSITREENAVIQANNAPNIAGTGLQKLEEMFAKAKGKGLKRPKFRIGDIIFQPAPAMGRNPGAIYVSTKQGGYMGKIVGGKYLPKDAYGLDLAPQVAEIAMDPLGAAVASGKKNGWCACCGKELTDPDSVKLGIGPVCAKKFFDLGT